jgi:hypothetical protein
MTTKEDLTLWINLLDKLAKLGLFNTTIEFMLVDIRNFLREARDG